MLTTVAGSSRPRCARLRPRARALSRREAGRHRVLKFQLGFNPTISASGGAIPARHRRVATRRLRQDGRREPDGGQLRAAGRVPLEDEVERLQVLIMGPVMNLLLAVVVAVPSCSTTAPRCRRSKISSWLAASPWSPASRADIAPGDRISTVNNRGVNTWRDLHIAIGTRLNRPVTLKIDRNGAESDRQVTLVQSPNETRFEVGDIGVLPDAHPRIVSVNPRAG